MLTLCLLLASAAASAVVILFDRRMTLKKANGSMQALKVSPELRVPVGAARVLKADEGKAQRMGANRDPRLAQCQGWPKAEDPHSIQEMRLKAA
ncbi:MAG TPA: hypothetical protein VK781_12045, partial [Solirubrobacteraceae bacterium]|nr:hypothetical protein [Solirubrobacteraceae bacterium]